MNHQIQRNFGVFDYTYKFKKTKKFQIQEKKAQSFKVSKWKMSNLHESRENLKLWDFE